MRRIELENMGVKSITLDGDADKPDTVLMTSTHVIEAAGETRMQYTFEVPTWVLTDDDVSLLRDVSFLDEEKVRVVLEVEE